MADTRAPPVIFAAARRIAVRRRMRALQARPDAARYVLADMTEDVLERLAFLRFEPAKALVIGDWSGELAAALATRGAQVVRADPVPGAGESALEEERPFPFAGFDAGFDLVVSLGLLDTVNDLPGALIHMREALGPGGRVIASFAGAGSLPALREAMLVADAERPAARLHPMVDVRAAAQLIQRAGWLDPVVDTRSLAVRYGSLERLVGDLRQQGLGQVLVSRAPRLGRAGYRRARAAFAAQADAAGRVTETFELITMSGRRSLR